MRKMKNAWLPLSLMPLLLALPARADFATCADSARIAVKNCETKFESIRQGDIDGGTDEDSGARDVSKAMRDAANANSALWAGMETLCRKQKERCARDCQGGTVHDRHAIEQTRLNCFAAIERKITESHGYRGQNAGIADGSAASGNGAGDQTAEELTGSNDRGCAEGEVCGERNPAVQNVGGDVTNLDKTRQLLQQGFDCQYSGASLLICGKGGVKVQVPAGPGSAFQPWTGF